MTNLFLTVLDMSLTASVVIGAVLVARFLLRKQPKILSYALWSVVLFRLLCPVSFAAPVSVLEVARPQVAAVSENTSRAYHLTAAMPTPSEPVTQVPQRLDTEPSPVLPEAVQPMPAEPEQTVSLETLAAWIWLAGMAVLVLRSLISFGKLRRCLVGAAPLQGNVFLADHIPTPFVLGIFRPKIYLPSDVSEAERRCILEHEAHHIRRLDHIFKLLGYLALCLHWFNPLVWLAFCLSGKDMEMSCDEAVIRKLGEDTRADYAETLLRLTTRRSVIAGMPLAFGEGDTESRVKNLALWRKPKLWAVVIAAILCALAVFLCAGNPGQESRQIVDPEGFAFDIPGRYQVELRDDDFYFLKKNETAGGLRRYEIPEEYRGNALEAIGEIFLRKNPEYGESKDILRGTEADGCLSLQLISAEDGSTTQHHFYEHGTWLYELWFDSSIMPEEDQRTIWGSLERPESVLVPTEEQPSATEEVQPITMGLNLPEDVTDLDVGAGEKKFFPVAGGQVVSEHLLGGVRIYETPELPLNMEDVQQWLQALEVPQILDGEQDWMAGSSLSADLEVSFADAAGLETMHYYYIKEQQVFELWLDTGALDADTRAAIVDSVTFGPDAKMERTLPRIAQYGVEEGAAAPETAAPVTIGLCLPADVVDVAQEGQTQFFLTVPEPGKMGSQMDPEQLLGGIRTYEAPEQTLVDMSAWLQELGVPQMLEGEYDWMASSGNYADLEVSFADAAGRETMHYYYRKDQQVFELWLDTGKLDAMTQAAILQSVTFGPEAKIQRTLPMLCPDAVIAPFLESAEAMEESVALERCRGALEELQGSDYHVKLYRSRYGGSSISDTETQYHWFHGENWLQVNNPASRDAYATVVSEGQPFRALYRDGEYYNNIGSEQDVLSFVSDDKAWENRVWLHRFSWEDQDVVYRSTTPAGRGQCIQWQVMAPYDENLENGYHHYFVNFIFDEKVVLQRVEITAYYQHPSQGDYSIQETISILGRGFSQEEIEKAYGQAEKA